MANIINYGEMGKCKFKPQLSVTLHFSEWLGEQTMITRNTLEDAEKLDY